jgi:hypothetical protein
MSLKGAPQNIHRGGGLDRERTSGCWQREQQSACLRVELGSGEIYVLPYQHFVAARLAADGDSLTIEFSTHDVQIEGKRLREIALALRELSVAWVAEAPVRYQGLTSATLITAIRVAATE